MQLKRPHCHAAGCLVPAPQDNGETWRRCYDVERSSGEFSYPAIIPWTEVRLLTLLRVISPLVCPSALTDQLTTTDPPKQGLGVCMTYTHNRQTLGFLSISLDKLLTAQ